MSKGGRDGGRIYQEGTAVHCGMRVTLRIALPDSMDPVEIQQAVVAWTSGNEFGVQFSKTSSDIQRRVRQVFSQLLEAETAEQDDRIITLTFPHAAVS
ncbi:MAG TPA: hypothetical protein VFQ34_13280 [Nitrospiraceae bacterium]|nr:hypothetical protein [Nitrospiraceae bacterium]